MIRFYFGGIFQEGYSLNGILEFADIAFPRVIQQDFFSFR